MNYQNFKIISFYACNLYLCGTSKIVGVLEKLFWSCENNTN